MGDCFLFYCEFGKSCECLFQDFSKAELQGQLRSAVGPRKRLGCVAHCLDFSGDACYTGIGALIYYIIHIVQLLLSGLLPTPTRSVHKPTLSLSRKTSLSTSPSVPNSKNRQQSPYLGCLSCVSHEARWGAASPSRTCTGRPRSTPSTGKLVRCLC